MHVTSRLQGMWWVLYTHAPMCVASGFCVCMVYMCEYVYVDIYIYITYIEREIYTCILIDTYIYRERETEREREREILAQSPQPSSAAPAGAA